MRTFAVTVALAAMTLGAGAAAAQDQVVRIATEGAYPPYNSVDASGQLIGFEVDLGFALCERAGLTCEFVAQDWDGIIPALLNGRYDLIMAGMSITDERREQVDFSRGYITTPAWFLAAADSDLMGSETFEEVLEALQGRRVGAQRSTIHSNFLEEEMPGVSISLYDAQDDIALDLAAGRIDAGLADSSAWDPFLESPEGAGFANFGPSLTGSDFAVFGEGVGIAFRQGDPLRERFDAALDEMRADGSLAEMATEWFGHDVSMP